MPPKARTWTDGLDNLGENLIRLSSALKTLETTPTTLSSDTAFASAIGQAAAGYARAFRQTRPVLVAVEKPFLGLVPSGPDDDLPEGADAEDLQQAHTLLHEGILASQEIVSLLERAQRASETAPAATRQILEPALAGLADSTGGAGWELRTVCHEYQAEVRLYGTPPTRLGDIGPGARGLLRDMAGAARRLRAARREWFRIDQRLAAATGVSSEPVSGAPPENSSS